MIKGITIFTRLKSEIKIESFQQTHIQCILEIDLMVYKAQETHFLKKSDFGKFTDLIRI
jgi:hypothetical protein